MANSDSQRWVQRFENLNKAFTQLNLACDIDEPSPIELAGLIKTFEIAFELSWKTMKDLLYVEGYDVKSPRETIMRAFDAGLIVDSEIWLEALQSRNRMSHTYDEQAAEEAERLIKKVYAPLVADLIVELERRQAEP